MYLLAIVLCEMSAPDICYVTESPIKYATEQDCGKIAAQLSSSEEFQLAVKQSSLESISIDCEREGGPVYKI